jgi:hypothetical protein
MSRKEHSEEIWKAPKKSMAQAMDVLSKHVSAMMKKRRETQIQTVAMNKKVTEALAKELAKAKIDINAVGAVSLANSMRNQTDMSKYRKRKPPTSSGDPRLAPYLSKSNVRNFAPFNQFSIVRTRPYDISGTIRPSPNPSPTSFWFANANVNGSMSYFLDTPMTSPAPSNFDAGAAVGIAFNPMLGSIPSPFVGIAALQMSAGESLLMSAHAGANIFGYGHSEGSVGWIIEEFDEQANFTGIVESPYVEQYYLDATWGQSARAFINPPSFSSQTGFLTIPGHFYIAFVWLWGDISASGAQGWWASQASGFGEMVVQSISLNWSPFWWF